MSEQPDEVLVAPNVRLLINSDNIPEPAPSEEEPPPEVQP